MVQGAGFQAGAVAAVIGIGMAIKGTRKLAGKLSGKDEAEKPEVRERSRR